MINKYFFRTYYNTIFQREIRNAVADNSALRSQIQALEEVKAKLEQQALSQQVKNAIPLTSIFLIFVICTPSCTGSSIGGRKSKQCIRNSSQPVESFSGAFN